MIPPPLRCIRRFSRGQGGFAACGRRGTFPAMGKYPMAQATLSWPFGPIHLEDRRGTPQRRTLFAMPALPTPSVSLRSTSPPDRGSRPPDPHYGGALLNGPAILPARKIRSAWVQFNPGPQGPWVCKICPCCGSTTAPGFAEPTLPMWKTAGRSGTGPYGKPTPVLVIS